MMIFGFRGRWSKHQHETGEFFCARCGGDRTWVATVLRRWFTLFFIPLFPAGKVLVTAIQCTTCGMRFDRDALAQPTSSVMAAELQGSMRLAVATVVRAAGTGPNAAATEAVRGTGLTAYDDQALVHDLANLDVSSLDAHLDYLAGALSLPGREQLLGTLAGVTGLGAGALAARPALDHVGQRLGLSAAHVAGVLAAAGTGRIADSGPPSSPGAWPAPPPTGS